MTFAEAIYPRTVSPVSKLQPDGRHRPHSAGGKKPWEDRQPGPIAAIKIGPASQPRAHALRFGRFRLMLHSRELLAGGVPLALGNRALDVLFALIEARGELVTKDELLSRVWPNTIVEENNLQFQVSTLRKVLGDDRDFIRTVSGRGYRFVAEIVAECRPSHLAVEYTALGGQAAVIEQVSDASAPGNLCEPASDIVGREAHLKDLSAMIAANRLVTLVGAGGIGKTRLALELARRMLPSFANGVWVAEFGRVSDPGRVLTTIASALGLGADANSLEGIAASLNAKHLLLVLDNCEHIIEAATGVAEALLKANPALQIIATSREPLRAEGEWVYRVPPLDVPPEDAQSLEDVLQHGATKLFIERVRAAEPFLPLDARMAAATATICRRLDGIPLAIELAAARAVAFGVEGLAAIIDDRLSLLADGRRTAPARHQTLRATFDWSYELLTGPERAVMRRLAVFAGDFSMEAAIRVAGGGEILASDVVLYLANLVNKSLIAAEIGGPSPRYHLLGTMRAYAVEKLRQSSEFDAVAGRSAGLSVAA
jgi:predicted ATPase/DNA-binding winged helix-turn-helix (wHTH) protein